MKNLDLTIELAKLLDFTAEVAVAIRMFSAYNRVADLTADYVAYDLMYLSDSLHNFSALSDAIASRNQASIIAACDMLISNYNNYENKKFNPCGRITFDKYPDLSLDFTKSIFEDIKQKVLMAAEIRVKP